MRSWALLAAAVVGAQLGTGALLPAQEARDRLVGCYELAIGPWHPALPDSDLELHTPPDWFRLRPDTIDDVRLRAEPPIRNPHSRGFARAWWEPLEGDSVRVVWSDSFTGAELRAAVAGDSLVGRVIARSDQLLPGPEPEAAAVARRTECR